MPFPKTSPRYRGLLLVHTVVDQGDVRRRMFLLKPAVWDHRETLDEDNSDEMFYTGIRAAWEQQMVDLETALWDVNPSSVLASYGQCAEAFAIA